MNEQFTIECEQCHNIYDDVEDACPHCGEPNPLPVAEDGDMYTEGDYPADANHEEYQYDGEVDYVDPNYQAEGAYAEEGYEEPYYEEPYEEGYSDGYAEEYVDDYADEYHDPYGAEVAYDDPYSPYADQYAQPAGVDMVSQEKPSLFYRFVRFSIGCLSIVACGLFTFAIIGAFGAYNGYQEAAAEVDSKTQIHYEKGLVHLENGNYERALSEFDYALSFDPNFEVALNAKAEAETGLAAQPTPTSIVIDAATTGTSALLEQAEDHIIKQNWIEAVQALSQLRAIDSSYELDRVSEMIFTANYQLGIEQRTPEQIDEAVLSFERALVERPDDPKASAELDRAMFYNDGQQAQQRNKSLAVDYFTDLYDLDPTYLDVDERVVLAHELLGDDLALQGDWCEAELEYAQAVVLAPNEKLRAKTDNSGTECLEKKGKTVITTTSDDETTDATDEEEASSESDSETSEQADEEPESVDVEPTPTPAKGSESDIASQIVVPADAESDVEEATTDEEATTETENATDTEAATVAVGGNIYYTGYNKDEDQWLLFSIPASGGQPKVILTKMIMPALSADGRFLMTRSEAKDSEGLHLYDLHTGKSQRITIFRQDVLPRFGGDSGQFVYNAQEPATGIWKVHQGFTDGLTEANIIVDGRTPDWAKDGALVIQTTTPDGNNPGLYFSGFLGGQAERITTHESDRKPHFSPNGSRIAYMSTQSGNWDIYVVSRSGGDPKQITTYGGNDGLPVWSPDGNSIAYVSDKGGVWAVYTIPATGGTPTKLIDWSSLNREDWLMSQIAWGP
ncbi:tetratricopeptide repeat protein [Anaerolineales bacterium HSG6]|nr:tetratricopeptide repeat protein [Anaerolineales bacterium HSG6]MDM8532034.1 tetratricopeptide repeat protein [Anaerolineales bacterium HSG25]